MAMYKQVCNNYVTFFTDHEAFYKVSSSKHILKCFQRNPGGSPVPFQESVPPLFELEDLSTEDLSQLALPFTKPACTSSKLVGGKGCQLALLTQMNSKVNLLNTPKPGSSC